MINQTGFFLSLILILFAVDCSNTSSIQSCKQTCREKQSLCFIAVSPPNSHTATDRLTCEMYGSHCISDCSKSSSKSKSSSRSSGSSRSNGSSSSGSGSKSSGSSSNGGSSSSGGSSSNGSGGSSHTITVDTGN